LLHQALQPVRPAVPVVVQIQGQQEREELRVVATGVVQVAVLRFNQQELLAWPVAANRDCLLKLLGLNQFVDPGLQRLRLD
jgi:hypothetical protein